MAMPELPLNSRSRDGVVTAAPQVAEGRLDALHPAFDKVVAA